MFPKCSVALFVKILYALAHSVLLLHILAYTLDEKRTFWILPRLIHYVKMTCRHFLSVSARTSSSPLQFHGYTLTA
jgi:hypothetical protein